VGLVDQHAMHMRHIESMAGPALQLFSTSPYKQNDFKKVMQYKTYVLISSITLAQKFLILRRNERNE
jgi:hypothetical protein